MKTTTTPFALLLAALWSLAGCYHYVPAVAATAPQGTPLRAHLNTLSNFELAQITVNNIDRVEGEMVRADAGELILSATWLQAITGNGYPGDGWTVRIPQSAVTAVEERRLSWWRTGIVIAGGVVATWLGFEALGLGPTFGGGQGGTGTTQ
jgi:hypothetical protein